MKLRSLPVRCHIIRHVYVIVYVSFFPSNLALFGINGSRQLKEAVIALKKWTQFCIYYKKTRDYWRAHPRKSTVLGEDTDTSGEGPLSGSRTLPFAESSQGGMDELALWGLFIKGTGPNHKTSASWSDHLPKTPLPNTTPFGGRMLVIQRRSWETVSREIELQKCQIRFREANQNTELE